MQPCLAQVCSLNSPFEKDVEDYAAGACHAIEVWLTKLETYLESHSLEAVRELCERHGVTLPVASFQGGLLVSQGDRRQEAWSHFAKRLELCRSLNIGTIVVACDIVGALQQADLERAQVSLTQAAFEAGKAGLRIALEFQGRSAFGNNLQTAAALVNEIGSPHLGVCFDAFHFYTGPSKFEDLAYLTPANLFHVQVCDLADVPREFAADADRILPGDGDFQLPPIVEHLRSMNYRGTVSIELLNPRIWQIPARQFGEIAMTALRKLLGQASME
jgi:4-hydroxyphenylpyruvate dioxygenase